MHLRRGSVEIELIRYRVTQWAFIVINIAGAFLFYWLGRVPKNPGRSKKEKKEKSPEKA